MSFTNFWRHAAAVVAGGAMLALAGCSAPPAYEVSQPDSGRVGTVESITQDSVQKMNSAVATIGGALIGGGLGSLVGGGTGKTVATVVGAVGGGFVGHEVSEKDRQLVWRIAVRYDDGSYANVQQTQPPNLRIGDRVRVTASGIELLR